MGLMFEFAAILVAVVIGIITYFQRAFKYWERKKVPFIQPRFPFGTMENPFTRKDYVGIRFKKHYEKFKSQGHKHGGLYFFARPTYMPVDPEYIKNIMAKGFQHFPDHGMYYNEKDDPLSAHLFNIEGQKWRNLRSKLTPTFTSGKMKMMFQTLVACSDQLIVAMDEFHEKAEPLDIKDVLGCFTTDIIGSCAFGIECNSFKNPDGDFRRHGKKIFSAVTKFQAIKNTVAMANHKLGRVLGIVALSPEVREFFMNVVKDTVGYREKNNFVRKDFMQILIDLKNNKVENDGENGEHLDDGKALTIEQVAAQAFVFFIAGFETSSTTMTFCLLELALNPDIQERARDEVNRTFDKYHGQLTYDSIMELKYMSQVIDETLRKYPPASMIPRKCVQDYQMPGTDVIIDKGTTVMIPVLALHRDPDFFPSPEKFDPERFSEENKSQIAPFTYIPFGDGPRVCIGARFGLMQTKVGLAVLLKNYKFSVNPRTNVPIIMDPFSFILTAKGGVWLDIEKIGV